MRVLVLLLFSLPLAASGGLTGAIIDPSGAVIKGARVELRSVQSAVLASAVTDEAGLFSLPAAPAQASLRIEARGFGPLEIPVTGSLARLELRPLALTSRVTVTASRGLVEQAKDTPQLVAVRDVTPNLQTVGHALQFEPGIMVQQSAAGQVSPFLRGLTGYHVLNLIDGVRFNNSTFRSGPNQYLAYIEPSQAQRIEVMLGPGAAQYGSDTLGGTIQVLTPEARFSSGLHGEANLFGGSADGSAGGNAEFSLGSGRFAWLGGAEARRYGNLRAGAGLNSRNVFTRLFGVSGADLRRVAGSRQQDTGYDQQGFHTKLAARPTAGQSLSIWYQRGSMDWVRGNKDLLGGLGRLRSDFDPQQLDFFYARWEKLSLGRLDSLSTTFSVNSQRDGAVRQGLRETDAITLESNRVDAFGYSAQATSHLGSRMAYVFGADVHDERISAMRTINGSVARPLYPDGSVYRSWGGFGHSSIDLAARRLRLTLGGRLTGIHFRMPEAPRQTFSDATFQASLSWQVSRHTGFHFLSGRGFRAPNLNDLGALGLNDLGYEIPAAEAVPGGALLGNSAGEGAVPTGRRVEALRPESLLNYEAGFRINAGRFYARAQVFDAEMSDPIVRRTLLFPAAATPSSLAGLPVTVVASTAAQRAAGVAAVATAFDPRAVKAFVNDGQSRYTGTEATAEMTLSTRWSARASYAFLAGRDLNPNRPVRRLPPQSGAITLRYLHARYWVEVAGWAAGAQRRLSGGDLDDERIGASRSRKDIADFFNGSRVREISPTGETLLQIQDRVLPLGSVINGVRVIDDNTRVPLYASTAGWATFDVRGGVSLGERVSLLLAFTNLFDRNYRVHGSGIDAPGAGGHVQLSYRF